MLHEKKYQFCLNAKVIVDYFALLIYWSRKLATPSQPIKCKTNQRSILQLPVCLPSLWTGVRLRLTLLWYKCCCFSNVNYFVIMPTRYWSLSQHGHLQPHSKSKAWQLSTQLSTVKWPITSLVAHIFLCFKLVACFYFELSSVNYNDNLRSD